MLKVVQLLARALLEKDLCFKYQKYINLQRNPPNSYYISGLGSVNSQIDAKEAAGLAFVS